MSDIEIEGLVKIFPDGTTAVDGLSLRIESGEVVSLLGPSGCGKTTTLRCVAGLETPNHGRISVNERTVFEANGSKRTALPPEARGLSMVFQQYALWPHMTVAENVAYGLTVRKRSRAQTDEATRQALDKVKLWAMRDRRISQLSGGQQQRIALARAIAFDPKVILFDEPLSNLDAKLRETMRLTLLELQRDLGFTALYVTHDQLEAISLSSRVAIMNHGRIEQQGSPREVWNAPQTAFVADFLGESNVWTGRLGAVDGRGGTITTDDGLVLTADDARGATVGTSVRVYVNIGSVELTHTVNAGEQQSPNRWSGRVTLVSFQGSSTLVKVSIGDASIIARAAGGVVVAEGDEVTVGIEPTAIRCYPDDGHDEPSDHSLAAGESP